MKKKQILVEGSDCSGKTTLVERLKNTLCFDAKALHHLEGNQFRRYLREYALQEQVIFNRGHFSEIVYSQLWRGGNPYFKEEQEILNAICKQNMVIIFACPPLEVLQERYQRRSYHQQMTYSELATVSKSFQEVMHLIPCHLYHSASHDELGLLVEKVVEELK